MADQDLGKAVLKLEVDASALKTGLEQARKDVEATTRQTRKGSTEKAGQKVQTDRKQLEQQVRRFNLRSTIVQLENFKSELDKVTGARQLNIQSSWTKALQELKQVRADLQGIRGGGELRVKNSWAVALEQLQSTKQQIDSVKGAKKLNIQASWSKALGQLQEVKRDLEKVRVGPSLPISGRLVDGSFVEGSPGAKKAAADKAKRAEDELSRTRERAARELLRQSKSESRQTARRLEERRRNFRQGISSALIGGGFPLLFGQGGGAAAGGALGGIAGQVALGQQGGFAGSIVGTALGAAFDETLAKGILLADALDDPIKQFGALSQAGLTSSKAVEKNVKVLISQGRAAEAAAQIQADAVNTFGDVSDLQRLSEAGDNLRRATSQAGVALVKFVAGPLADFINKLSAPLQFAALNAQVEERAEQLGIDEGQLEKVRAQAREEVKGLPTAQKVVEAPRAVLRLLEEQFGLTKDQQQAADALAKARAADADVIRKQNELIVSQAQGIQAVTVASRIRFQEAQVLQAKLAKDIEKENNLSRQLSTTKLSFVATQKETLKESQKQLLNAEELAGKEKTALTVAKERQKVEEARRRALSTAEAAFRARVSADSPEVVSGLQSAAIAAANELKVAQIEAGETLRKNARDAAKQLQTAQQSLQGVLRGGFEFLSPQFRQQELARARASITSGERRGLLRGGIDISTPERLFAVANFVESFNQAEDELQQAIRENTAAQQALAAKEPVNVFVSGQAAVSTSTVGAINRGS